MMLHKRLKELGVPHHICPSPRHLTESCGIALKFPDDALEAVKCSAEDLKISVKVISDTGGCVTT
jgi:hypothetical protein